VLPVARFFNELTFGIDILITNPAISRKMSSIERGIMLTGIQGQQSPRILTCIRRAVFLLSISATIGAVVSCSRQDSSRAKPPFLFLFEERPFQMNCSDWPAPMPPGTHSYVTFSPSARYARTRLEALDLPMNEFPALTIAADPYNSRIQIGSANQNHWKIQHCAKGLGDTAEEATRYLRSVSMQRTGSLLTLNGTDLNGLSGGESTLLIDAPADAPVIVHSWGAIEVHDVAGPVRVTATRGRAIVLNTSGLVDASAQIIDYASSKGEATLNADWEINIKLTAQDFSGHLNANAQQKVHAFFPAGFQTPMEVYVNRPSDFDCRTDFCTKMKKSRENSLYRFTYGELTKTRAPIHLRSETSQITLDTIQ
jgi:hypothetical protein